MHTTTPTTPEPGAPLAHVPAELRRALELAGAREWDLLALDTLLERTGGALVWVPPVLAERPQVVAVPATGAAGRLELVRHGRIDRTGQVHAEPPTDPDGRLWQAGAVQARCPECGAAGVRALGALCATCALEAADRAWSGPDAMLCTEQDCPTHRTCQHPLACSQPQEDH